MPAVHALGALAAIAAAAHLAWRRRPHRAVRVPAMALLLALAIVHGGEALEWSAIPRWVAVTELFAVLAPPLWLFTWVTGGLAQLLARAQRGERQLELVFAQSATPLALFDTQGKVLLSSPGWSEWRAPAIDMALTHLHALALASGQPEHTDRPIAADAGDTWVELVVTPWRDGDRITGTLVVLADVSAGVEEATHADQRLDELRHHDRLELIGLVAAGVAHDIRNTLMAIDWHADAVGDPYTPREELAEVADDLKRRTVVTSELLASLTGLARKKPAPPAPLDLARLVDDSRRLLRRSLPPRMRLTVQGTELPLVAVASPVRIHQVLINLLVNARDATRGRGDVTVTLGPGVLDGRPAVSLAVSDDGCGISEADQAHMFEPLFTTKGTQGTGLGLAIVQSIVDELDGAIAVESTLGQGTTVRILLPRAQTPARDGTPTPSAAVC